MSIHKCQIGTVGGTKSGARASAARWCNYVEREAEYGNKDGLIESFVRLPDGAPEEWRDPHALWSAVAENEKPGAILGREFMVAFQDELTFEQNKEAVIDFVELLVARGLAAHVAIHSAPSGSLHAHITTPDRQITDKGKWARTKQTVMYSVRKDDREMMIPASAWQLAKKAGYEKVYRFQDGSSRTKTEASASGLSWKDDRVRSSDGKFHPVTVNESVLPTTPAKVAEFREMWADCVNRALEKHAPEAEKVSHLSYIDQGKDIVPGVHMGALATKAEREGYATIKGEKNRAIAEINEQLKNPDLPTEERQELIEEGYAIRSQHFDTVRDVQKRRVAIMERVGEVLEALASKIQTVLYNYGFWMKSIEREREIDGPSFGGGIGGMMGCAEDALDFIDREAQEARESIRARSYTHQEQQRGVRGRGGSGRDDL